MKEIWTKIFLCFFLKKPWEKILERIFQNIFYLHTRLLKFDIQLLAQKKIVEISMNPVGHWSVLINLLIKVTMMLHASKFFFFLLTNGKKWK